MIAWEDMRSAEGIDQSLNLSFEWDAYYQEISSNGIVYQDGGIPLSTDPFGQVNIKFGVLFKELRAKQIESTVNIDNVVHPSKKFNLGRKLPRIFFRCLILLEGCFGRKASGFDGLSWEGGPRGAEWS